MSRRDGACLVSGTPMNCGRARTGSAARPQHRKKVRFRRPVRKGATDFGGLTASLKRIPDTKLEFSAASLSRCRSADAPLSEVVHFSLCAQAELVTPYIESECVREKALFPPRHQPVTTFR